MAGSQTDEAPGSGAAANYPKAGRSRSGRMPEVVEAGRKSMFSSEDLKLAEMDDGQGRSAIYELRTWQ